MTTAMDETITPVQRGHASTSCWRHINVSTGLGSNAPRGMMISKANDRASVAIAP